MFLDYYGLPDQPFGATPDPRFLYFSRTHREAQASLWYGIHSRRGFVALVATPGMGKTTLLLQLLERLRSSARTAFLFQTQCDSRQFLRYLLGDLGLDSREQDPVRMHEQLNELLLREAAANRRVVVIIDEAQNLDESVLETVRLLSDFETPREKLMQIVLAGQPDLAAKLARPSLAQLGQRIGVLCRLDPLSPTETALYIQHRLQVAGNRNGLIFTSAALESIAEHSQGIPRNINTICFNALSLGCALRRKIIEPQLLQEVFADLSLDSLLPESPTPSAPVAPPTLPAPATLPASAALPAPAAFSAPASAPTPVPAPVPTPAVPRFSFLFSRLLPRDRHTRALVQAVLVAALFVMAVVASVLYIERTRPQGMLQATPPMSQGATVATVPAASGHPAKPLSSTRLPGAQPAALPNQDSPQLRTHIVGPNDSLGDISVRYLGKFDARLLQEILALNNDVKNPDLIVVGQRIRLPQAVSNPGSERSAANAERDSTNSPRKEP